MENLIKIRYGWLKIMYIYNALGAGLLGLATLLIPDTLSSVFNLPAQDPVIFGIVGSTYLAFGLVSLMGIKSPLKFVPVLLLQMTYKIIWFAGVVAPLLVKGQLPSYSYIFIFVFATYIAGNIIAIPFRWVFNGKEVSL